MNTPSPRPPGCSTQPSLCAAALVTVAALLSVPPSSQATDMTTFSDPNGIYQWNEGFVNTAFDPSTWTITFSDAFNYDATLANIKAENVSAGDNVWYTPVHSDYPVGTCHFVDRIDSRFAQTFISNTGGTLTIRANRDSGATNWYGGNLNSVRLQGLDGFNQSYGYFEIKAKLPVRNGTDGKTKYEAWPAFWLLSMNEFDSPRTTNRVEIDAIEWYSNGQTGHHATVHLIPTTGNRCSTGDYTNFPTNLNTAYHTFGVKVTPHFITTYVDRMELSRFPAFKESTYPFYMLVTNSIHVSDDVPMPPDLQQNAWDFIIDEAKAYALPMTTLIDNPAGAPQVTTTGTWTTSTTVGGYGTTWLHDGASKTTTKTVKFTPNLPTNGVYNVRTYYYAQPNRSTNTPFIIQTAGGTQTILVNQTINGGQWYSLGNFKFNEGTGGSVTISNAGTAAGTYTVADAVQFVLQDPWTGAGLPDTTTPALIKDNAETNGVVKVGTWTDSTGSDPSTFYGINYCHDGMVKSPVKSITFTPTIAQTGTYDVYARWPAAGTRTNNVPFTLNGANGSKTVLMDQTQGAGGKWIYVGTIDMNAGTSGNLVISNSGTAAGTHVIVDAVKFVWWR